VKDLSFLSDIQRVLEAPMAITGDCSGRVSLAQRVITMLMSSTNDPARTYSVGLLQDIGASNVLGAEDLENQFTLAVSDAREIITAEQAVRTDLGADDMLADIIVDNLVANGDTVSADIQIISVSGEVLKVSLEI